MRIGKIELKVILENIRSQKVLLNNLIRNSQIRFVLGP